MQSSFYILRAIRYPNISEYFSLPVLGSHISVHFKVDLLKSKVQGNDPVCLFLWMLILRVWKERILDLKTVLELFYVN